MNKKIKQLQTKLEPLGYEYIEEYSAENIAVFINLDNPAISLEVDLEDKESYKFELDDDGMFLDRPLTKEERAVLKGYLPAKIKVKKEAYEQDPTELIILEIKYENLYNETILRFVVPRHSADKAVSIIKEIADNQTITTKDSIYEIEKALSEIGLHSINTIEFFI